MTRFVETSNIAAQNTQELYLTPSESEDILQNVGQAEFEKSGPECSVPKTGTEHSKMLGKPDFFKFRLLHVLQYIFGLRRS